MKPNSTNLKLAMLGSALIAFVLTLITLRSELVRNAAAQIVSSRQSQPVGHPLGATEQSGSYREFVMNILQTRHLQPERTPEEWMRFLWSLDSWYRTSKADCVSTLSSNSYGVILGLVEEPLKEFSSIELANVARNTSDSRMRFACYQELWERTALQGPKDCAQLWKSMPAMYQPFFRSRLIKLWVTANGLQSLSEISAVPAMSAADIESAFELCAAANPQAAVDYLGSEEYQKLQKRTNLSMVKREALLELACAKLPPEAALDLLYNEPQTTSRDGSIRSIAIEAVKKDPSLARGIIARDPQLVFQVCGTAQAVAFNKPRAAAEIVNMAPGERLRTSIARQIALRLPPAKADEFVGALTDLLTRETVRSAVDQLHKAIPINPKNEQSFSIGN